MAAPTMDIDYFMALLNAEFAMDRWEHNSEFILDALNYVRVGFSEPSGHWRRFLVHLAVSFLCCAAYSAGACWHPRPRQWFVLAEGAAVH